MGPAPTLTDTARALAAHPRFRWLICQDPDLADAPTAGLLLAELLADDPTARLDLTATDVRLLVTDHTGARRALSGQLLGDVLARGLLVRWGPA